MEPAALRCQHHRSQPPHSGGADQHQPAVLGLPNGVIAVADLFDLVRLYTVTGNVSDVIGVPNQAPDIDHMRTL